MRQSMLNIRRYLPLAIAALVLVGLMISTVSFTSADRNPNPGISPIHSTPGDQSYGAWGGAWWKWAAEAPASTHPVLDDNGAFCGVNQSGSVWFLAGTFGGTVERDCTIPTGKALFFPILNSAWITVPWDCDPANPDAQGCDLDLDEMLAFVNPTFDGFSGEMSVTIDDRTIEELESYRAMSTEPFTIDWPTDSVFGVDITDTSNGWENPNSHNVADGFWLMVRPLKKGDHVIEISGTNGDFELDVTYNLTVD